MTAEIAILNKSAIALAADSAITVSSGIRDDKVYDSADKLFALSDHNPLGIMIYNSMSFMQAPLSSLLAEFRRKLTRVKTVSEAADSLLDFLHESGRSVPDAVKENSIHEIVWAPLNRLKKRIDRNLQKIIEEKRDVQTNYEVVFKQIENYHLDDVMQLYSNSGNANFVGNGEVEFPPNTTKFLQKIVKSIFKNFDKQQKDRLLELSKLVIMKSVLSEKRTGIVIAGFGSDDLFPTLVSVEIDGMICDRLKFIYTNKVSIDRGGPKAKVIPFAQKEMVERFLYGIDEGTQKKIITFCEQTVPEIRTQIFRQLVFGKTNGQASLEHDAQVAEAAFVKGLRTLVLEEIRNHSQAEIEDMVEFMPKPELAKMAEALVDLTSIKRRVSRGLETVGGPIDVAVISQAEGFVWIKRKHYFPAELNSRYFARLNRSR